MQDVRVNPAALVAHLEAKGLVVARQGDLPPSQDCQLSRDSRQASQTTIFCAYQGVAIDSHSFIPQVIEAQSPLIIHDRPVKAGVQGEASPCLLQVIDSRQAWAEAWSFACGEPGGNLTLIGVTGTNGKSSVTWLIHRLLTAKGYKGLLVGTIGAGLAGEDIPLRHTTPDPEVLYPLLARAVEAGCAYAVMEVASHAIAQHKLAPLKFALAGFTSFSRDHLDLHGTLAEYFATKALLFSRYAAPAGANDDSPFQGFVHSSVAQRLKRQLSEQDMNRITIYGNEQDTGVEAGYHITELTMAGTELTVKVGQHELLPPSPVPLITEFQLANLTAALVIAEAFCQQQPPKQAKPWPELLGTVSLAVPGRMEAVTTDREHCPLVVIDYAHTPDAVAKALQALKVLKAPQITVIVGCGGDRDPGKRPLMAKAAIAGADNVVFTTDNPRTEAPLAILADMTEGLDLTKNSVEVIVDRQAAIEFAITRAAADEVILLAGKGHESYQEVQGERRPFDEIALVQAAFALRSC